MKTDANNPFKKFSKGVIDGLVVGNAELVMRGRVQDGEISSGTLTRHFVSGCRRLGTQEDRRRSGEIRRARRGRSAQNDAPVSRENFGRCRNRPSSAREGGLKNRRNGLKMSESRRGGNLSQSDTQTGPKRVKRGLGTRVSGMNRTEYQRGGEKRAMSAWHVALRG